MGNAQSMIRTSGALDSFVAELGPDIIYEGRYVHLVMNYTNIVLISLKPRIGALSEDR